METSLKRSRTQRRRWVLSALALCALAFLLLMVRTGSIPQSRQLATFAARGVLQVPPERIRQVTLTAAGRTVTCIRTPDQGWMDGEQRTVLAGELLQHLDEAIRFMHTAGPVRVLRAADSGALDRRDFGLEHPLYTVVLADGQRVLLKAHFGTYNPQDLLQYMQLTGSADVYLMSRFVGQAWEHLWSHLLQHIVPP